MTWYVNHLVLDFDATDHVIIKYQQKPRVPGNNLHGILTFANIVEYLQHFYKVRIVALVPYACWFYHSQNDWLPSTFDKCPYPNISDIDVSSVLVGWIHAIAGWIPFCSQLLVRHFFCTYTPWYRWYLLAISTMACWKIHLPAVYDFPSKNAPLRSGIS